MTKYSKRAPNGVTYTLEGPPGATDDEIIAEILHQNPEAAGTSRSTSAIPPNTIPTTRAEAKAKGVPRRSVMDYLNMAGGAIQRGGASVAEQLAPILPLVGPLASQASQVPQRLIHALSESSLKQRGTPEPETDRERLAMKGIEAGTAAAFGGGGGIKGVASVAGSGVLSGLAGEKAAQMGFGPTGQVVAALAGGMSPSALSAGKNASGWLKSHWDEGGELAAKEIRRSAAHPDKIVEALSAPRRPAVPGSVPTTAEVLGDRGVGALERNRISNPIQTRQVLNAQARTKAADEALGVGSTEAIPALGSRVAARQDAEREAALKATQAQHETALETTQTAHGEQLTALEAQNKAAVDQAEVARQAALENAKKNIGPVVETADVGSGLRGDFDKAYKTFKRKVSAAYNVPILKRKRAVDLDQDFVDELFAKVNDRFDEATDPAHARLTGILNKLVGRASAAGAGGRPVTAELITNADKSLADFAGTSTRQNAGNQAAFANEIRALLEKHVSPQLPERYKTALAEAKALRKQQGDLFETPTNPVAKTMADADYNRNAVSDIQVPERLIKKGTAGGNAAKALINAIGPETSERAVRARVRELIDDGKLNVDNVVDFKHLLKEFPQVRDRVNAMSEVGKLHAQHIENLGQQGIAAVKETQAAQKAGISQMTKQHATELAKLEDAYNKSSVGRTELGKVGTTGGDASSRISDLLSGNKEGALKELIGQIKAEGDPDAMAGLRRAFAEHIRVKGGRGVRDEANNIIPGNDSTLNAIEDVLKHSGDTLTADQRQMLENVRAELGRTNFAKGQGIYETPEALNVRNLPITRSTWPGRIAQFVKEHFSNEKKVNALIEEMLLKPEKASEILRARPSIERMKRFNRTMRRAAKGTALGSQSSINYPVQQGQ